MGKWDNKLATIRNMSGCASTQEIAKAMGTSVSNLHKICHRNNISLPRDPTTYKCRRREVPEKRLEAARDLLLNAGYKVYAPNMFSTKADLPGQAKKA